MESSLDDVEGIAVVRLHGEVDMKSAPALRDIVERAGAGGRSFVVDLAAVEFFDSSGLKVLDDAQNAAGLRGVRMILTGLSARVLRLFEITGLGASFELCPDVDSAIAAVRGAA